ncbi:hypothetical protein NJNGDCLN_00403 [Mannheimia haemolytica]
MRKYLAFILAVMSGFAMAEAPKLSGSIDETTESVAPGFHNHKKMWARFQPLSLSNHRLFHIVFVAYK